jgi:hypothetical protein
MSARWLASAGIIALLVAGCGGTQPQSCTPDAGTCVFDCKGSGKIDSPKFEGATHQPQGTPITYQANPPASGDHWPVWSTWGVFDTPVPVEQWVHNLEHGGIVLLYNCVRCVGDMDCTTCQPEIDELTAIRNAFPPDRYNSQRIIVTPDPMLPTRFAAVAWLYRWQSDTLDQSQIECFINARYDHAPESLP